MLKYVLFDLDGTLLPMDLDEFVMAYFKSVTAYIAPFGYAPKALSDGVLKGTAAMVTNDGTRTNAEAFWQTFAGIFGDRVYQNEVDFNKYYDTAFNDLSKVCGRNPSAGKAVADIKNMGLTLVLATNPLFPRSAQARRLTWAGVDPNLFDLYTSYDNMHFCKPNPQYYQEIISLLECSPNECLMVGNDVGEDMIAEDLGMQVFLLPAYLINKNNKDISRYPQGNFDDLKKFIAAQLH